MMKNIALLAVCLVVFASPSFAKTFGAEEFMLDNGLQVVVIPNDRAPVVTHMLWIKAGGADGQPGISGMAHYLEHLLFKGTPTLAAGEYSKTIKTLGGDDNAFTGQDYTAFFESVAVANLPKVMEMEADRMRNISPPPDHFSSEKEVVLEERRQRTDNDPRARFGEQMQSVLYVNHPYAIPIIGWFDEIKKYEWTDIKKFYDTWYAPNNAILIVSGDITASELKPLAEKYYGAWLKKDIPSRTRPSVPPAIGQTALRLYDDSIHQPVFQRIYLAPSAGRNRKDSLALQVLAEIMNGSSSARLYRTLVVQQKKLIQTAFNYNDTGLDYGSINVGATPAPNVTPEEAQELIDEEIRKLVSNGVSDAEVKSASQRLRDQAVFARDSVSGPAMIFGAAMTTGSSVADIENWPDDIAKVTAADVKQAAQKYLDAANPWVRPPVNGFLLPTIKEVKAEQEQDPQKEQTEVVPDVQR